MTEPVGAKPLLLVVYEQIETVEGMIRTLEEMAETTGLQSWSTEVRHQHMMALDDLQVLSAYLKLYHHSLSAGLQRDY